MLPSLIRILPPGLETFSEPPTIRLAEGTSDLYAAFTARAVQLINSALPYEKRITLSAETLPTDTALGDIPEGRDFSQFRFARITRAREYWTFKQLPC